MLLQPNAECIDNWLRSAVSCRKAIRQCHRAARFRHAWPQKTSVIHALGEQAKPRPIPCMDGLRFARLKWLTASGSLEVTYSASGVRCVAARALMESVNRHPIKKADLKSSGTDGLYRSRSRQFTIINVSLAIRYLLPAFSSVTSLRNRPIVCWYEVLLPDHDRPRNPCRFICHRGRDNVGRFAFQKTREPGRPICWTRSCPAQSRAISNDQQAPQVRISTLANWTQTLLPAARMLSRDKTKPRRKLAPRLELTRIADHRDNCRCDDRKLAGIVTAASSLILPMPSQNTRVENFDASVNIFELTVKNFEQLLSPVRAAPYIGHQTGASYLHAIVDALSGDNAKFG